ncbi:MAG TPA: type II secretion system protein [Candidatus Kaiserbacteria bacterium]|nr:type II secretion system protein [Candidatus Kaiserbacteria bacterium]
MKILKQKRGFTLVETLVAVAILAIAVTGPFFSAEQSLQAAKIAQDKMTGSFLAQEGVEFARVMRDNSYLKYCYSGNSIACNSNSPAYWWNGFTTNTSYSGEYNILRCNTNNTCSVDASSLMSGIGFGTGSIAVCSINDTSCGDLYLTTSGKYTTQNTGTKTNFKRVISATKISDSDLKIDSTVSWMTHGKTYTSTVTGYLTPWY